ncbi:MAG TPA: APC family permease [Vicinamibacterales bacterium]|nr:APC family permease [Vicinamibacterales bacterium]
MATTLLSSRDGRVRVVVATTVLLSFISFWRAAAIVLNDLGSTAFYVGGIVEQAVGKAAPWFILGVMLFSYTVRAVYIESSAMFVRGGVYRVVKEAMGGTLAKLSVSALLFDYVLTGPISGVSAGQYIVGLLNDLLHRFGSQNSLPVGATAAFVAILITIYFWWRNTQGIHESSDDALSIMKVTTVMVVLMIAWCGLTLLWRGGGPLPPAPIPKNLKFSDDALGWLKGTIWPTFTAVAILIGFGHSILAMSGEESLAQVYREIEHPKVQNLKRTGMVIFVYSLLFTSLVSFFAIAIIPDGVRAKFYDNLISGLAMNVVGPLWARLLFQAFVVIVGFLILAGAVNTAIVGSNGVLNRVSEDGVLTDWFRKPHKRFGTTYRLINLVVLLQLVTIVLSRGDVYVLGEAYAFGVVWSFAFKSLAMFVLRYKEPDAPREWKVPLNPKIGGRELPVGLGLITLVLFAAAIINIFTKQTATISGIAFTLLLYSVFVASERTMVRRRKAEHAQHTDQFQLAREPEVGPEQLRARPGSVLVPVRDYNTLAHLDWAVRETRTEDRDIVVLTIRLLQGPDAGTQDIEHEELFTDYEQILFTRVVSIAERHGKSVKLLVVPSTNVFDAVAQTAVRLQASEIVVGESAKMDAVAQAHFMGEAWERTPHDSALATELTVLSADGHLRRFALGAHAPHLSVDDVSHIHQIWLEAVKRAGPDVHHRDIVCAALDSFDDELQHDPDRALARLRRH